MTPVEVLEKHGASTSTVDALIAAQVDTVEALLAVPRVEGEEFIQAVAGINGILPWQAAEVAEAVGKMQASPEAVDPAAAEAQAVPANAGGWSAGDPAGLSSGNVGALETGSSGPEAGDPATVAAPDAPEAVPVETSAPAVPAQYRYQVGVRGPARLPSIDITESEPLTRAECHRRFLKHHGIVDVGTTNAIHAECLEGTFLDG